MRSEVRDIICLKESLCGEKEKSILENVNNQFASISFIYKNIEVVLWFLFVVFKTDNVI